MSLLKRIYRALTLKYFPVVNSNMNSLTIKNNDVTEHFNTYISDGWGVKWDAMETVRDFLQNFYDANPVSDIKIVTKDTTVDVLAPAIFDWKELIIFGSDKQYDDTTVGSYGEGFKASLLNALRDFNCSVSVHVGDQLLEFYFKHEVIGKTTKRLIWCKRSQIEKINGTKLMISNCPPNIVREFQFGLNYFYHEANPLFGELLEKTSANDIQIYKSENNEGYLFYKKLLRAKLDIPLVIVCNRAYRGIDKKIKHDRDRKSFNNEVMGMVLKQLFRPLKANNIVNFLEPFWCKGHKILSFIAQSSRYNFSMEFPENYYAADGRLPPSLYHLEPLINSVKDEFSLNDIQLCPAYMNDLGMKTPTEVASKRHDEERLNYASIYTRQPSALENKSLDILYGCIRKIQPFLTNRYTNSTYLIGESEELIGELRERSSRYDNRVFLNKQFFLYDFSLAMSILLHEWGHIYGYDGSRDFTDALTEFIALIIKKRSILDSFENKWNESVQSIRSYRLEETAESGLLAKVDLLTDDEKTSIIKKIPEDELFKIMKSAELLS